MWSCTSEGEMLERLISLKDINTKFTQELGNLIKKSVVLCMSGKKDNRLMWSHYAKSYEGAVLAFTPNFEKDSCLALMEPVKYSKERYFPYKNSAELLRSKLSEEKMLKELKRLVSTKDKEWAYEQEYRLWIPGILKNDEKVWFGKFGQEEMVEVYLGYRMREDDKNEIVRLSKSLNRNVKIYTSELDKMKYKICFSELR